MLLAGRRDRGAGDLPPARHPARHARSARGVPPEGRAAVHRGYARGETPNPCSRCNGGFRFDELLLFARRVGASRLATGPLRADRRARRPARDRPRRRSRQGSELHARDDRPRACSAGSGSRSGSRRRTRPAPRPRRPGSPSPVGRESQEACFLGGDDYRVVPRAQRARDDAGPARRRERHGASGPTTASGSSRPDSAAGSAISAAEPLYAVATEAADEHGRRRAPVGARAAPRHGATAGSTRVAAGRGKAPPPLAGGRCHPRRDRRADSSSCSTSPPSESRAGQTAVVYSDGAIVGAGVIVGSASE